MSILTFPKVFFHSGRLSLLIGLLALILLLAACQPSESGPSLSSSVVAIIGREVITLKDLENHYKENGAPLLSADESDDARSLKKNLLDQLIDQRLFVAEAFRLGLRVTPEELNLAIEKLREDYSEEDFEKLIREQKIDLATWEKQLDQELLVQKLIQKVVINRPIEIGNQEMKEYYDEHRGEFRQKERVHARQIVLPSMKEAEEVHQLASAGHDFSNLARDRSISPDAGRGGALGQFQIDQMPKGFDVLLDLKPGKISSIIQTPYGFHIFKMEKREPNRNLTEEEAHTKIREILIQENRQRLFSNWTEILRKKANIKVNYAIL